MKRDLFWANLITRVAQNSAMTYIEAKKLNIDEFFVLLSNYNKKIKNGEGSTGSGNQNKGA